MKIRQVGLIVGLISLILCPRFEAFAEQPNQSPISLREQEEIEGLGPTLGEKLREEKEERREAENSLLLLVERRLRFFQEKVNAFLEKGISKKEAKEHFRNGERYFEQKKYDAAREEFEKTLAVNPEHKGAISYLRKIDRLKPKLR